MEPDDGVSGVYEAAPILTGPRQVPAEWIDYNGHMNVAYYSLAFDNAVDVLLEEHLGIGESYVKRARRGPYVLQNHLHYTGELLEGETFRIAIRLLDWDAKRLHLFLEMTDASGEVCATSEQLLMNVDLTSRRSTPYEDWAAARIAALGTAQAGLKRPEQAGAPIGIRRAG
jgi:acyl-CoA thioester hydrolase